MAAEEKEIVSKESKELEEIKQQINKYVKFINRI